MMWEVPNQSFSSQNCLESFPATKGWSCPNLIHIGNWGAFGAPFSQKFFTLLYINDKPGAPFLYLIVWGEFYLEDIKVVCDNVLTILLAKYYSFKDFIEADV